MKKSALICIGNELLAGNTLNSNLAFLGQELAKLGLPLSYSAVVRDNEQEIADVVKHCLEKFDLIITTGGLGPTDDDMTKRSIAALLDKRLFFDEEIWENITLRFAQRGMEPPKINSCQAEVPEGFVSLKNVLGTAPALLYEQGDVLIILLPGVPMEMRGLFNETIKPILIERYGFSPLQVRRIHTIDIPESKLAELICDIEINEEIDLAFIPMTGTIDLLISGWDRVSVDSLYDLLREKVAPFVWGVDEDTLPDLIQRLMKQKRLSLAVAESCTGGLIQKMLTDVPGASDYFQGGIVAYSNRAKLELLGVSETTLRDFGAVSEETAGEMATGVSRVFETDLGISVTGIAGPEGGTESKPVGTVSFAISYRGTVETATILFQGNRNGVRERAAYYLLNMLRKTVRKNDME